MWEHILVPTDGSKLSDNAAKYAIDMAKRLGAKITALHVIGQHPPQFKDEGYDVPDMRTLKARFEEAEAERAKKILVTVRDAAAAEGVACDTVIATSESVYEKIIEQAEKLKCDLIVMASHGRKGLQGLLLGSETAKVLTHCKIPVMVCR